MKDKLDSKKFCSCVNNVIVGKTILEEDVFYPPDDDELEAFLDSKYKNMAINSEPVRLSIMADINYYVIMRCVDHARYARDPVYVHHITAYIVNMKARHYIRLVNASELCSAEKDELILKCRAKELAKIKLLTGKG